MKVYGLDNGTEYIFSSNNGFDAIQKMLYTLNLRYEDKGATVELCNGRTWCLTHNGMTYACAV